MPHPIQPIHHIHERKGTCIPFCDFALSSFDSKFELRFQFEAAVIFPT